MLTGLGQYSQGGARFFINVIKSEADRVMMVGVARRATTKITWTCNPPCSLELMPKIIEQMKLPHQKNG
ncbi:MAG: hypothetical protein JO006_06650 [Paucibacter sp.]|nr:hypothetical protein [Roseateles sp.]